VTLAVYAVYDEETGEVVQLHVEPGELDSSPDEIVSLADVRGARRLRAVRLTPQEVPPVGARVVDGELRAEERANWGRAGLGGAGIEPGVERQYRAQPPAGTAG
jgi:hypothetical protein